MQPRSKELKMTDEQELALAAAKQGGGKVAAAWFPVSQCPHGYQNSFLCEKDNGGCKR